MERNDIEVIDVSTDVELEFAGMRFMGLDGLRKASAGAAGSVKTNDGPYVVLIKELYPCFDFEDRMNENRYYQNFYLTTDKVKAERILEEKYSLYTSGGSKELYPILEPRFSMGRIEEHHLPYIYYHGEGSMMQIVQNRKAPESEKVHLV